MEGVESLYKKFGVLADAKDKAGEFEEEYLAILSTIKNGSGAEKRLCASFVPRFFKSFPNHQDAAFNAQLDLCEEAEAVIRREAIKGLPDLCKADSKLIGRMANVLAQLLPIESHLDQTIVKHCLAQLLKQETRATITGIVDQVVDGKEEVKISARKFILERLTDCDKYFPNLSGDDELKSFLIEQLDYISRDGDYKEFVELMAIASCIDRRKTLKLLNKLLELEKPFDPTNEEGIERFSMVLPLVLKYHNKSNNTSNILKYFGSVLPVFSQIEKEDHQMLLLQGLAETLQSSVTEEDAVLCIDGIYALFLSFFPETLPGEEEEVDDPPSLNFSVLECLLFALFRVALVVPSFLKEEDRLSDCTGKISYLQRASTSYMKRLRRTAVKEDSPEQLTLKTRVVKMLWNCKELCKALVSDSSYTPDITLSWKKEYTTVTNRLYPALVSDKRPSTRTASGPHLSPTAKRRKGGTQQVYAPPKGTYSGNIGGSNGHDDRDRGSRRY